MGEGQWRLDDALAGRLAELDAATEQRRRGRRRARPPGVAPRACSVVRSGEQLSDDHLGSSDAIVPPVDLSLEEARQIVHHDDLIPDLP